MRTPKRKIIPPDFWITPRVVADDRTITPFDERVYSIIYWFRMLKNERCTAGNSVIAELAKGSSKSVQNSLNRLEEGGYILRTYKDATRRVRKEIEPLIMFGKVSSTKDTVSSTKDTQVSSTKDQNKSIKEKENRKKNATRKAQSPSDPFLIEDFIKTCRESSQRHIRIVAEYADEKRNSPSVKSYTTRGQWRQFLRRNLRPAKGLVDFSDEQIAEGFERMRPDLKENGGFISKWGLETVNKYIIE